MSGTAGISGLVDTVAELTDSVRHVSAGWGRPWSDVGARVADMADEKYGTGSLDSGEVATVSAAVLSRLTLAGVPPEKVAKLSVFLESAAKSLALKEGRDDDGIWDIVRDTVTASAQDVKSAGTAVGKAATSPGVWVGVGLLAIAVAYAASRSGK